MLLLSPSPESQPTDSLTTLAAEIRSIMIEHTAAVESSRASSAHANRVGALLNQAQARVRAELGPGHWLEWLAELLAGCNLSLQMAKIYMRIARNWHRLPELLARYPSTHPDISWFRKALRKAKHNEPDDHEAEDAADGQDDDDDLDDGADADELAGGGCGGDGVGRDEDETDTSDQTVTLPLAFTVATLATFRQQVRELAMHLDIKADTFSARLSAVIDRVHAAVIHDDNTTTEKETDHEHDEDNAIDSAH